MTDNKYIQTKSPSLNTVETTTEGQKSAFTAAQIELLNAMAWLKTDDDIRALQHAISEFFAMRADDAMEQLWGSGEWNEQTLHDLRSAHYRTPYNRR